MGMKKKVNEREMMNKEKKCYNDAKQLKKKNKGRNIKGKKRKGKQRKGEKS